jgi:hypothetical protein
MDADKIVSYHLTITQRMLTIVRFLAGARCRESGMYLSELPRTLLTYP